MKRLLSLVLTLALVLSLIPAVFAEATVPTEPEVFDFTKKTAALISVAADDGTAPEGFKEKWEIDGTKYYINKDYSEFATSRYWRIVDISENIVKSKPEQSVFGLHKKNGLMAKTGTEFAIAVSLKSQYNGFYVPEMSALCGSKSDLDFSWYMQEKESSEKIESYKGCEIASITTLPGTGNFTVSSNQAFYAQKDKEMVSVIAGGSRNFQFYNITYNFVQNPKIEITSNKTELNTTDNKTASITSTMVDGDNINPTPVAGGFVKYYSDHPEYATVDADTGVITAVSGGEASIWAETKDYDASAGTGYKSGSITVTVTSPAEEPEATPDYEAAFGENAYTTATGITFNGLDVHALAYATDGSDIAPTNIKATDNKNGTYTVTTDAEVNGYTFRYWAKGLQSKERKRIVSFNANFTYTPSNENNYLIAVYDKEGTISAATEYYNANGQRIDWKEGDLMPYMAGYGQASGWKEPVYGIKEAIYGEPIKYNITIGDAEPVEYAWGTPVECPEPKAPEGQTFWGWKKTVNDVDVGIVSTDRDYTFYAWESCTVTPVFGVGTPVFDGEKRRIILGTFTLGDKTAVMAEFFGFDNAFERGITIDGTDYAMTNKNAKQFTIVDDNNKGNISGYAILEGGVKYIYNLITNNNAE